MIFLHTELDESDINDENDISERIDEYWNILRIGITFVKYENCHIDKSTSELFTIQDLIENKLFSGRNNSPEMQRTAPGLGATFEPIVIL